MENIRIILKPVIDLIKTGQTIKKLRKSNDFSVHDLQEIFGFEYPQAIYAWEQGKNAPSIDNLLVLARLFKVSVDELIEYNLVQIKCFCSEHAAACMNQDPAACEQCRYRKTA